MSNRRKGRKIYTYRVKNRRMFSKYHPMRSALGVTVLVFLVALFGVVGYSILGPLMTRLPKEKENPTRTPDPYVFTTAPVKNPGKIRARIERKIQKLNEQLQANDEHIDALKEQLADPELSSDYEKLMEIQKEIEAAEVLSEDLLNQILETEEELEQQG